MKTTKPIKLTPAEVQQFKESITRFCDMMNGKIRLTADGRWVETGK